MTLRALATPPRSAATLCRSDFQKIVAKIMKLDYRIPEKLNLSPAVKSLLGRIFVKDPAKRITIAEIKRHEWYLHRLPYELYEGYQGFERCAAARCIRQIGVQKMHTSAHTLCGTAAEGIARAGIRRARSTLTTSKRCSIWHGTQALCEAYLALCESSLRLGLHVLGVL